MLDRAAYRRADEVFQAALERPAHEREAFAEAACDGAVLKQVVRMLTAHAEAEDTEHPLSERAVREVRDALESGLDTPAPQAAQPETIGSYRVIRELGRGGMSVVYECEQERPKRRVAVKLIDAQLAGSAIERRLELEAEILGRLRHEAIAQVHEAGLARTAQGERPYFAMELIDGESVTVHAERHAMDARARLALLARIADGVEHAHRHGVIHRDLKPGNILVTASGQPKILDFGVARATDSDLKTTTLQTSAGVIIGTLSYMSPEQASADHEALDTRSDVYALGVVGFELLTGDLPYEIAGVRIHEAVAIIRDQDPTLLSSLDRTLRGDVETIIGKALAKEPSRRYASAAELAADIRRHLANEPIHAAPPSTWYQLERFARRNKALVGGVAASFLILIIGIIATSVFAVRAHNATLEAQDALGKVETVTEYQQAQLSGIDVPGMGERLRKTLAGRLRASMELERRPEHEIESAVAELNRALEPINFTDVSMSVLGENIFDPSASAIVEQLVEEPLVQARLLQTLAGTLLALGLTERSDRAQADALRLRVEHLHELHPDRLESEIASLRRVEMLDARREHAVAWADICERCERGPGPTDALTLTALTHHAQVLKFLGDNEESTELSAIVAERRSRLGTPTDSRVTDDLADRRRQAGRLRKGGLEHEGAALMRTVYEDRRVLLGDEHPTTQRDAMQLATMLEESGRVEEAELILGPIVAEHGAGRAIMIHNYGFILYKLGRYDDAETALRRSLALRPKPGDAKKGGRSANLANLALVLAAKGETDEAESLMREVLPDGADTIVSNHWRATSLAILARVYFHQGRHDESERLLLRAIPVLAEEAGEKRERTLRAVGFLIDLYEAWELVETGRGHAERAIAWRAVLEDPGSGIIDALGAIDPSAEAVSDHRTRSATPPRP